MISESTKNRFADLVPDEEQLDDVGTGMNGPREPAILERAKTLARDYNLSIREIVDNLAGNAFTERKLLAYEFLAEFRRHGIARELVNGFIAMMPTKSAEPTHPDDPYEEIYRKEALDRLLAFIEKYGSGNGQTLNKFLERQRKIYPEVNYRDLFEDPNLPLVKGLIEKIDKAAEDLAQSKIEALFKEHPQDFILNFIIQRVFQIKPYEENSDTPALERVEINQASVDALVAFLDEQGYLLEDLYCLLYAELKDFLALEENALNPVRYQTRDLVYKAHLIQDKKHPFIDEGLDFDALWKKSFEPAIKRRRSAKIKPARIRLIDVMELTPKGMAQVIKPPEAQIPYLEILESIERNPKALVALCRDLFNYLSPDGSPQKGQIERLTDEEVLETIAQQLKLSARIPRYIVREALKGKGSHDPIRKDCRIPESLENCGDLHQILLGIAQPKRFIEAHPDCKDLSPQMVSHFALKMFEFLLLYRKEAFQKELLALVDDKLILEEYLKAKLDMREIVERVIHFRVRVEIDPETEEETSEYEVVRDPDVLKNRPKEEFITEDRTTKKYYRYYPVEKKNFQQTNVKIPDKSEKGFCEAPLLIYSGDGSLVHIKGITSYVSSCLRNKAPSDERRWSAVSDEAAVRDAMREFLYASHSTGHHEDIKDTQEKRVMHQKGKKTIRSERSKKFSEQRDFSSSLYLTAARRSPKGELFHTHIKFETHVMSTDALLLGASDYTPMSHSQVYTTEREWGNLFRYICPPAIFGKQHAQYQQEGFSRQTKKEVA